MKTRDEKITTIKQIRKQIKRRINEEKREREREKNDEKTTIFQEDSQQHGNILYQDKRERKNKKVK